MMKRFLVGVLFAFCMMYSANAETYSWAYDIKFEAPEGGRCVYNTRDRVEVVWQDMALVIQVYSGRGVNERLLKQNLQHRASEYNMFDTRTEKYDRNSLRGFLLTGTLPDGSTAEICNVVSEKSGIFLQLTVNYTSDSAKDARKLLKSIKEDKNKKKKKDKTKRKQKVQKKDTPPKPIKKPTVSPTELYEI